MKAKYECCKRISICFILMFCVSLSAFATANSVELKRLFDNYRLKHREYQDSISEKASVATVKQLGEKLKLAHDRYFNALGVKPDSIEANYSTESTVPLAQTQDTDVEFEVASKISAARKKFNKMLVKLYSTDREKDASALHKELEEFISSCDDPEVLKDATFELADLVFDYTGKLSNAQKILVGYLKKTNDKESRRQAVARVKMYRQKAKVNSLRKAYQVVQQETISKWKKFSETSWFNLPKKMFLYTSFGVTNAKRFTKAKTLDKALADYNEAVVATFRKGSIEELSKSRIIPCNSARILVNGRTSFHYRFENAKRAEYSLYVQTLLFQDDETGNKLTDIMIERCNEGVDVRLILDDFFSFRKKDGVIQRLRNAGVKVMINNPILKNVLKANFRSHQKLFIIDEKIAIVGGMNIGDEYAKGEITEYGWRDTDVELRGPVVRQILDLFEKNWEELTLDKWTETGTVRTKKAKTDVSAFGGLKDISQLIPGPIPVTFKKPPFVTNVNTRFVTTEPIKDKDDDILDLFIAYLDRARTEVIFESAYFIPTDSLKDAIARAVTRGVKVKIITNSLESNNHPSGGWAGRYSYEEVLNSGAEIYEWRGAQTVHSKVGLFDDFAVTLGAYNMNSRSHACDSEDIIAFEDFRVARIFKEILYKDLKRCHQVTLSEVQGWDKVFMNKMRLEFFNKIKFMF